MDESTQFEGAWLWTAIEKHIDTIKLDGPDEFRTSLNLVPDYVQCLLPVYYCNSEICNGGFHQLFKNPTGVLFPDAITSYELIGASSTADVMKTVFAMFRPEYPRDQTTRHAKLSSLEKPGEKRSDWDPFYDLDDEYYSNKSSEQLVQLADNYAKQHHDFSNANL